MSLEIALSGINAVNSQLESISNNIANSGTYGYKASRANFSSMYAGTQATGAQVTSLTQSIDVGGGVQTTGRDMDASIQGRGFFVSRDSTGSLLYSRVGIFSIDKDGYVTDSGGDRVQGFEPAAAGQALGAMGDLRVPTGQIAASATTSLRYVSNLSADWTVPTGGAFDPADPLTFNGSMVSVVYDSLGAQHSVTQYFVKTADSQVTTHYTFDGVEVAGLTTQLDFGTAGQLVSPTGSVALNLGTPTAAEPLTVNVDYTGTTQFAGEATSTVNAADGYASGSLISVQIDNDGNVLASYSNGQRQSVGTVALATFPNEGALAAVSGTSWAMTSTSGTPLYFAPGSGLAGSLTGGTLEQSNVDVTAQLVGLMSAQRNYQANAKVISTESQMIQALMQAI
jgi:flagellar hook protein FlgE